MEHTGFSPGQEESPLNVTSSGSYLTPEPHGKYVRTDAGAVGTRPMTTQSRRVPVACATASGSLRFPRDDEAEQPSHVSSSPKAPSRSSVTSSNMLERHAELVRARELASKRKQVREAELEELEIDAKIAALSPSQSGASGVSRRSVATPSQRSNDLTESNVRSHTRKTREGPVEPLPSHEEPEEGPPQYEASSPATSFTASPHDDAQPLPAGFDHETAEEIMRSVFLAHEEQRQAASSQDLRRSPEPHTNEQDPRGSSNEQQDQHAASHALHLGTHCCT
jgi:hypothetical protein